MNHRGSHTDTIASSSVSRGIASNSVTSGRGISTAVAKTDSVARSLVGLQIRGHRTVLGGRLGFGDLRHIHVLSFNGLCALNGLVVDVCVYTFNWNVVQSLLVSSDGLIINSVGHFREILNGSLDWGIVSYVYRLVISVVFY